MLSLQLSPAGVAPDDELGRASPPVPRKSWPAPELSDELVRLSGEPAELSLMSQWSLVVVVMVPVGPVVVVLLLLVVVVNEVAPQGSQVESSLHQSKEEVVLGAGEAHDLDEAIQQSEAEVVVGPEGHRLAPSTDHEESPLGPDPDVHDDHEDVASSLRGKGAVSGAVSP